MRLVQLAEEIGFDFQIPFGRWIGQEGETDYNRAALTSPSPQRQHQSRSALDSSPQHISSICFIRAVLALRVRAVNSETANTLLPHIREILRALVGPQRSRREMTGGRRKGYQVRPPVARLNERTSLLATIQPRPPSNRPQPVRSAPQRGRWCGAGAEPKRY